jgi:hypothetical protein
MQLTSFRTKIGAGFICIYLYTYVYMYMLMNPLVLQNTAHFCLKNMLLARRKDFLPQSYMASDGRRKGTSSASLTQSIRTVFLQENSKTVFKHALAYA